MYIVLSIWLFVYLSLYVYLYLYIFISTHLSIFLSFYLSVFLSFYISIFLSFYISIFLSFYLSIYLPIYLSIYLSILLKYNCIYNTRDTSGVQHMYTMHPAGPLGQVTDTIAQRVKGAEWTYNHIVYKLSWFLHGSGANNPGSTIQVSHKQYHCAHTRTTVRTYLRRVGNNNGNTNCSKWRYTSRRYNSTRIDQHAQIQNDTTNIHRRVWYLRGMEVQVPRVHGTNGQCATTITREHRELHNNNQGCRFSSSSLDNRGSKQVDTIIDRLEVHSNQHVLRSSSNNMQTTPDKQWLWDLQTIMHTVLNTSGNKVNRILDKTTQAYFWHEQFWGDIFTMGIWAQQVWTRQWTSSPRIGENSSHPQWDKRTTTTTPSALSWTNTKLQSSQNNNHGILQSNNSIQQTETTDILKHRNKPRWRSSTNGHFSSQRQRIQRLQRKRKVQRKRQRKRKELRRIQGQRKRKQGLQQWKRSSWIWQSFWIQRATTRQRQRKRTQRKTSTRRVLQMWTTRTHRKEL